MVEAYRSGDPYLAFGKQAGRIPPEGTKKTHAADRELFKACVLGTQYAMEAESLALRIGKPMAYGRELLRLHRQTYPTFRRWSDGAESFAMLLNRLRAVFGWTVRVGPDANPRSLRNFPCQANGAEMMRLACCLASEGGVNIVAPVHDVLMVEGPADAIEEILARTQEAMAEASAIVLSGFRLRSDAKIVRWPDRYMHERGREFWCRVARLLASESKSGPSDGSRPVGAGRPNSSWHWMAGRSSVSPGFRPTGAWIHWRGSGWCLRFDGRDYLGS
jgi:DNA polymerase-1